tara:strand:+ start:101 stop:280 length:180 start_codon:yes stop_codon:yes gene_type:complete
MEAKMIPQGPELVFASVTGGVFTFRCEREFTGRAEYMTVSVNRTRRQLELWDGRLWVEY